MTLTVIILLIVFGYFILLLEIFVLPGGIVGMIGFLLMVAGVVFAYNLDQQTGHWVLGGTFLFTSVSGFIAFKAKTWDRMSLKSNIDSKAGVIEGEAIKVGDTGTATSRLAPMGKARIGDKFVEVRSHIGFIDEKTVVEVVKVDGTMIIVKPKNGNNE